ncbi:MAG TPA: protein translocase subunit SecF [Candidatus Vogelbacteria bacterium]|uniref:Protein-export membrane protein SecF n=1 Tax=Candidatus Vogelbacteria bacterium RIFOXYD1_FULL_51_18 TaxID=1802440 RepID=A0A1G2QLV9_9BACT|nr:MAG: Protein translocase subunit SecF [Parcubacteria group bacterium GW2011_GWC1_51_35]KKW23742.1 MAG: Protein translocase subunit SecF [Parcubacteria group bacterium GW2011_GWF2_52_12]OHA60901.1 MAG: protein-export membrane protein SecF [Candidatus Vogelbacteria bacterium RIFOXYD1_FULL_51_18]HBB65052.1 protein translocase subunit SecF [Candidatus Vogelbacteria bacterium]
MVIIKYRSIFLSIAALMVLVSWGAIAYYGLNLGIDFTGGAILELEYPAARPNLEIVQAELVKLGRSDVLVQPIGEKGYLFRAKELSDTDRTALTGNSTVIKRFDAIGPTIGRELANKALIAIALVLLLIIAYIALAFRKVSKPVASWKYGLAAIIALAHDISIPTGLFAYLGYARGTEINALFLTALLAILGLSVSDTIVVFDRVRENLQRRAANTFVDTVGLSLNQVFTRSINISLTTLIALTSVYFFGGESTRDFALTLIVGMTAGIYSSIFIASPLLILFAGKKSS